MPQNRNKLMALLVGNLTNVVVHKVLEASTKEDILRKHYDKESMISFHVAQKYRGMINPIQKELPEQDVDEIKEEVLRRAKNELGLRISKGYEGIDLSLVEKIAEEVLRELKIKTESDI